MYCLINWHTYTRCGFDYRLLLYWKVYNIVILLSLQILLGYGFYEYFESVFTFIFSAFNKKKNSLILIL